MFYDPILTNRWFKPGVLYSDVDWTDFATIVAEFDSRIREWYVQPARALQSVSGHFAFPVMALACMLLDTLSQFYSGDSKSSRATFIDFVRQQFPQFNDPISPPVERPPGCRPPKITDTAEALYFGFRCGILHEAHVTSYGAISGLDHIVQIEAAGVTRYRDGRDCPTVIFDPHRVLDELDLFLKEYVDKLRDTNTAYEPLRRAFKAKFSSTFGVDISNAN